ncbi:MAG: TMEM175 family protein [Chordicoccus sp.]
MDKNRVMAFTDAIIAIAATIMVLEIKVPENGFTIAALLSQWPVFAAYAVSYFMIYLAWRSHHNAFQKADVLTTETYLVNGIWLFLLTLVPFGTGVLGRYPDSRLAAVIYVGIVFLWTFSFQFLDASITRSNPSAKKDEVRYPAARGILFGGFALAFLSVAIHPSASLVVLAISNAVMIIHILREKRRYV